MYMYMNKESGVISWFTRTLHISQQSNNLVSAVMSEDEEVLVGVREGLLQCVSWVAIQQYLSRGRITTRINWLNISHSKNQTIIDENFTLDVDILQYLL